MTEFVNSRDVVKVLEKELRDRIEDDTKMQCKVCWYVYDPAQGCPESQTPPGTPFKQLPDWWTCPECGNSKDVFLPFDEDDPT